MTTNIERFTQGARDNPQQQYTALMGMLSNPIELLACFEAQPGNKALGIDGVTRSGIADYTALYDRMNAAISKVYLGHTAGADSTPGKLGGEDNAGEVREDLIKADADLICGSFNRTVAKWLTWYNDGDGVAPPQVWRKIEPPEDLQAAASKDKILFDIGFKPTIKYITDKYGEGYEALPNAPGNGDTSAIPGGRNPDIGAQQQPNTTQRAGSMPGSQSVGTGQADAPAQFAESDDIDPTSIDSQTEQLASEAGSSVKAMVDQIAAFAEQAESLEALRDKLLASYGDLDSEKLTNVMAMGFAAAELSGRFDVSENG